ncbi:hypothetical protein [Fischerella muscicola]|nr:hypothetical protein [Fischerella muscicola]MBD2429956.1 hypothetical protein [Fischerella sp. FACHB-380]
MVGCWWLVVNDYYSPSPHLPTAPNPHSLSVVGSGEFPIAPQPHKVGTPSPPPPHHPITPSPHPPLLASRT